MVNLEQLELDYNYKNQRLIAAVRTGDAKESEVALGEFKKASDAYYGEKYKIPARESTR